MIYKNANQRAEEMQVAFGATDRQFKMASVVALSESRPIIRFSGEGTDSKKLYKYMASYSPSIGDIVLLARIEKTYVILGRVI